MIDYVFAVVVGVLGALAAGYAYRAARAVEELVKKLASWEEAWRQYYSQPREPSGAASPAVSVDYVAEVLKKVSCAGELMRARGGCAPVDEVSQQCGVAKRVLYVLFAVRGDSVCLRT